MTSPADADHALATFSAPTPLCPPQSTSILLISKTIVPVLQHQLAGSASANRSIQPSAGRPVFPFRGYPGMTADMR